MRLAIDEICLRKIFFYLLVVNRALCRLFLNDCHLPFECTSYTTALTIPMVKRCDLITFRFKTTKADAKKLSRLNII